MVFVKLVIFQQQRIQNLIVSVLNEAILKCTYTYKQIFNRCNKTTRIMRNVLAKLQKSL